MLYKVMQLAARYAISWILTGAAMLVFWEVEAFMGVMTLMPVQQRLVAISMEAVIVVVISGIVNKELPTARCADVIYACGGLITMGIFHLGGRMDDFWQLMSMMSLVVGGTTLMTYMYVINRYNKLNSQYKQSAQWWAGLGMVTMAVCMVGSGLGLTIWTMVTPMPEHDEQVVLGAAVLLGIGAILIALVIRILMRRGYFESDQDPNLDQLTPN